MRVAIRADANDEIGAGHVMRCLALAQELRAIGADVSFLSRGLTGPVSGRMDREGFLARAYLPTSGSVTERDDALETVAWLSNGAQADRGWDWIVVDHYGLGEAWESHVAAATGARILAIDDLAVRPHRCEVLLDQNLKPGALNRYRKLTQAGCALLLGPSYALLRPEFAVARGKRRERRGSVRRVLVTFGGSDPTNETAKVLQGRKLLDASTLVFDVVIASTHPLAAKVDRGGEWPVRVHVDVENMAALMLDADVAICAGGSTTWERMCLGLPGIVISVAHNQLETARYLGEQGFQMFLGESEVVGADDIARTLTREMANQEGLYAMAEAGRILVDGEGARRVAKVLREIKSLG